MKPQDFLHDDAEGITAQFNLNILVRMNRELNADFDLDKFGHKVIFNEELGRVEMHIESTETQSVMIRQFDHSFVFDNGETIHTENSHTNTQKYKSRRWQLTAVLNPNMHGTTIKTGTV
jgi:uncharacterized SAM-dependent methyltransferase